MVPTDRARLSRIEPVVFVFVHSRAGDLCASLRDTSVRFVFFLLLLLSCESKKREESSCCRRRLNDEDAKRRPAAIGLSERPQSEAKFSPLLFAAQVTSGGGLVGTSEKVEKADNLRD